MNMVILISNLSEQRLIYLKKLLDRTEHDTIYIVASPESLKFILGRIKGKLLKQYNILVVNKLDEEKALKIYSLTIPDIVVDCDTNNYFEYLKKIYKHSSSDYMTCGVNDQH